jgi:hypothetical protein
MTKTKLLAILLTMSLGVAVLSAATGAERIWTEADIKAAYRHHFTGEHEAFEAAWADFRSKLIEKGQR